VELERDVAHLELQLGVPQLGGRSFGGGELAGQVALDAPVEMRPADLQLGGEVARVKRVFWNSNTVLPNALRSLVNFTASS
jgi:hypothetical protein